MKIRRKKFDGVTRAYGVFIGQELEFEVPDNLAHFFVNELGYEKVEGEKRGGRGRKSKKEAER